MVGEHGQGFDQVEGLGSVAPHVARVSGPLDSRAATSTETKNRKNALLMVLS